MQQPEHLTVRLEREYATSASVLFSAIADGTLFELTGANDVSLDFRDGGEYYLDFGERNGKHCFITGQFTSIIPDTLVILTWNVAGFRSDPDVDTVVTFAIAGSNGSSKLSLTHEDIKSQESADGKSQGWKEVLDDLEARLPQHSSDSAP